MYGITDTELKDFLKHFEEKTFLKKSQLLSAGQIAGEIYFIRSGCLRLYYEKNGEDISAYFFTENMFGGAYDSFISQIPARHSIEALEDSHILVVRHEQFMHLLQSKPEFNILVRKALEERFVALHDLFTAQILDSPEERYIKIETERPDLLLRIPQHQIATYLGITPVSLSRIRKRLMKKSL